MVIFICLLIVIGTFLSMEGVAWFTHKYVMHGFLWIWHRSHHTMHDHKLERNDLFALVFSLPSALLIYFFWSVNPYMTAVGFGIMAYGIFYFIFHDIIVHQRIRWRNKIQSKYLRRMIKAHYIHHMKRTKEGAEAFGFLYASRKFELREVKAQHEAKKPVDDA
jgi:beta-carotene 3-hydroxylase